MKSFRPKVFKTNTLFPINYGRYVDLNKLDFNDRNTGNEKRCSISRKGQAIHF